MSRAREQAFATIPVAAKAASAERASFIQKTYMHLTGAVFVFAGLEYVLLQLSFVEDMVMTMTEGYNWLAVLGAFMVVGYVADRWARSATSLFVQYLGLSLYVVAEAVIFVPLLWIASEFGGEAVIPTAAILTLSVFTGLTLIVFITGKDFSFLRGILMLGAFVALGLIVASILFGFSLGLIFTVAMIALASGYILYYTSAILLHYRIGQHVAAALALFSAVALLFWYMIRLVLHLVGND